MDTLYTQLLSRERHHATAGVLQIDSLTILIDCGIDETLDL